MFHHSWSPPPPWLSPRTEANPYVLWLQYHPKYGKHYPADPATGRFYDAHETLKLCNQIKAQDEAKEALRAHQARMDAAKVRDMEARQRSETPQQQRLVSMETMLKEQTEMLQEQTEMLQEQSTMLQRILSLLDAQDNDDTLQDEPVVVESEEALEPLVVAAPTTESTERVKPITVEDQKKETQTRKPKAKRVKSTASGKHKSAKKKKQQQQRAKTTSPTGRYSFSASIRQFREHQLWFEVDPYYDREQSIFQLWTDMTRPPEDYDSWQ